MRNRIHVGLLFITMLTLLVAVGCSEPPTADLQAASSALNAAKAADAEVYAADQLDAATVALKAAQDEVDAQANKFALTRNYDSAASLIKDAKEKAEQASSAAKEAKSAAKQDAETALTEAKESIQTVETALVELGNCPKKPKGFETDLAALNGSLGALQTELGSLQQMFDEEDFLGAKDRSGTLTGQVETLLADLTTAQEKTGCGMHQQDAV